MSVAVNRISDVIEALAEGPQGATSLEIAARLKMGRQAASRLLDAMVETGLTEKDERTRRYRLALRLYRWGSVAVGRYIPPPFIRFEIADLAEQILHPVFYAVLEGSHVVTIERTARRGRQTLTSPDFRRNPWNATSSGRVLTAFQPEPELDSLLKAEKRNGAGRKALLEELEGIRRQGYAGSDVREGYTLAAPVLDEAGVATAAIGIGVNTYVADEREAMIRKLLEASSRVSANAGYGSHLPDA